MDKEKNLQNIYNITKNIIICFSMNTMDYKYFINIILEYI